MLFAQVSSHIRSSHLVRIASTNLERLLRQKEKSVVDSLSLHYLRTNARDKRSKPASSEVYRCVLNNTKSIRSKYRDKRAIDMNAIANTLVSIKLVSS